MDILNKTFGKNNWRVHHGRAPASNTDVKSLSSRVSNDGTAIQISRNGDLNGYVASIAEFEVFGVDLLRSLGYTVTSPTKSA